VALFCVWAKAHVDTDWLASQAFYREKT